MEHDEVRNWIAGQNERGLIPARRKDEGLAGAQIDFLEMDLETECCQQPPAKIVITNARAAGNEQQIKFVFHFTRLFEEQIEIINHALQIGRASCRERV